MRQIDLETLQNVLQGATVNVVESSAGELSLVLDDADHITVKATPSYDPALTPELRFYLDSVHG